MPIRIATTKHFFPDFKRACFDKLQGIGDQALKDKNYAEAIGQYTAVEPFLGDLEQRHELFLKRSEAHAEIDPPNWREALQDAEEVRLSLRIHAASLIIYTFSTRQSSRIPHLPGAMTRSM